MFLKLKFGEKISKLRYTNQTFEQLSKAAKDRYKIGEEQRIRFGYTDKDGDYISISSQDDLQVYFEEVEQGKQEQSLTESFFDDGTGTDSSKAKGLSLIVELVNTGGSLPKDSKPATVNPPNETKPEKTEFSIPNTTQNQASEAQKAPSEDKPKAAEKCVKHEPCTTPLPSFGMKVDQNTGFTFGPQPPAFTFGFNPIKQVNCSGCKQLIQGTEYWYLDFVLTNERVECEFCYSKSSFKHSSIVLTIPLEKRQYRSLIKDAVELFAPAKKPCSNPPFSFGYPEPQPYNFGNPPQPFNFGAPPFQYQPAFGQQYSHPGFTPRRHPLHANFREFQRAFPGWDLESLNNFLWSNNQLGFFHQCQEFKRINGLRA